ncbi:DUF6894 family protein [Rhizobium leguminosarum]|uniref:DUF6894 family protein n=1 Tax=Rhizobium leguminosarum TaxID=384 RepID=UPI00102F7815|nr:hypothetical protein ELI05_08110 [Rhizobium leguminosarum]
MSRFYFHIRTQEGFDEDYDGVELAGRNGAGEAVAIARKMVSELIANNEPIDGMTFEITDSEGHFVAELPFHCFNQVQ